MPYSHTTLAQLKTALAARLGDAGNVYWTNLLHTTVPDYNELNLYIQEALHTWSLITGYWRDSGQFQTVNATAFYDISTLSNPITLNFYTILDQTVINTIQYHLLEYVNSWTPGDTTWAGSEQFTMSDLTGAIQRRRDNLLVETGAVLTILSQALPANSTYIDLPDTTLQVRELAWMDGTTSTVWPLYPEDISNQRNYSAGYLTTPNTPQTFSSSSQKPLRFTLAPPSNEPGTVSGLLVTSGAALGTTGVALGVPDDMAWIVKWGALADILGREGPGQDLARAYFCERRWKLGIALAQISQVVVNAEINGVSLSPESISRLDQYNPNWQSATGVPNMVGSFRNIVALSPAPNGTYSVFLDIVRNAVVPNSDADFIQIGREYLDPLLDYCEHLASFKSGGMEFRHTFRAAENFFNAALSYNQRLAAQHPNILELVRQSTLDDYVLPPKKKSTNPPLEQQAQTQDQAAQMKSIYQNL